MSVNTAHANNGVLIHAGEYILLHSDNVSVDFSGQDNPIFKGTKSGRIYLTSHRMIFNNKKSTDTMQSFSAPFVALSDVEIEQPVFSANYIRGKVRAQPNGNYIGEVKLKLYFKSGGAIEYGQALLRAAKTAQSNFHQGGLQGDDPPPYTPAGMWHEAPPPAYQPPPGYYGWLPQHDAFTGPAPNTVYISDNPPPYPGIMAPPNQGPLPQQQPNNDSANWYGFSAPPEMQPQPGSAQGWGNPVNMPSAPGYMQPPPYVPAPGSAAPNSFNGPGGHNTPGYGTPGYPYGGFGAQQPGGFATPGYLPQQQPVPPYGANTNSGPSAMGFSAPPPNSKEFEASASAYNRNN